MYYSLLNVPIVPISLNEAKSFLRVDNTLEDSVITSMIEAAVEWGEGYTNLDFRPKNWEGFFSYLCESRQEPFPYIRLAKSPVSGTPTAEISIGGVYTANTDIIYKQYNSKSVVLFTGAAPTDSTVAYTHKITFSSGYAAGSLPAGIRNAVLEHISFLYENRGDAPSEPTSQIKQLYSRFRNVAGYA